ncbi:DUF2062 domain-containing protein [Hydrogenimonas cancrithermarum]|uniref:DUF2062 domain-containing protein n=1 Tax=Hydrogenimonas cancrithermarum TaxID=2993563 RepID=A0ABM8FM71_9BACT|nr:DUF2062 domain-containing protein [Hydrogenimonas cancrithermarum]BDY12517.1 hypothetical protein HCR_08290 [Hydrogenimonas cancrithermarum]
MVRKVFKQKKRNKKIDAFIEKYKIPREYLSVNRKSVTKALLVGIFIAFIPMPFQMLAVLAVSPFVRFNIPIAISMVWLSNPLTMPPMYYMEYLTGTWLFGMEPLHDVQMTLEWFKENLDEIFIPLYAGTLFYSVVVSVTVYYGVNWLWIHSVHKERKTKKAKR